MTVRHHTPGIPDAVNRLEGSCQVDGTLYTSQGSTDLLLLKLAP
ncbi:hypothetical protein [Pyxidicoccus xibeiensis]|nr:hypothetical protein [Pyxidicoccus xibeiensis]